MERTTNRMRVVVWGTYDLGKPRTRILLRGLRENDVEVIECHVDVWGGVEDKSQLRGAGRRLRFALRWLFSYPRLVWRYLRLPAHDAVLVGYMGQVDVVVLWPFAKLRRVPVVWDAFLSLYNTVVEDRRMLSPRNPLAKLLWGWEWLACRCAARVLLDTRAHGDYFVDRFRLSPDRVGRVFVGVETEYFSPPGGSPQPSASEVTVLFYGQFIPLHGIETIIRAARLAQQDGALGIHWIIVGKGQEQGLIARLLDEVPIERLEWHRWVAYDRLVELMARADVCLGIFSASEKASRVIPNKVFQVLAAGKPLITRDSPAIRELLSRTEPGIYLVPPEDPKALVAALARFSGRRRDLVGRHLYGDVIPKIVPEAVGKECRQEIEKVVLGRDSVK